MLSAFTRVAAELTPQLAGYGDFVRYHDCLLGYFGAGVVAMGLTGRDAFLGSRTIVCLQLQIPRPRELWSQG